MPGVFVPGAGAQKTATGHPWAFTRPGKGLVASIQSLEALKFILGLGGLLLGRILHIRGGSLTFKEIEVARNPDCVICQRLWEGRDDA